MFWGGVGEDECRERVVPDAPCVGGAVRVFGDPQQEVVGVERRVAELEAEELGEPGRVSHVVCAKGRREHVRLDDVELRDGPTELRGEREHEED